MSTISFTVNGKPVAVEAEPGTRLLTVLRDQLRLTGAKDGCGKGQCGSCTVVLGKKAVRACVTPIEKVQGKQVLTVEGLAENGKLHPLQQAFLDCGAVQCGFCTPGMLMTAYALLLRKKKPTREDIVKALKGNLCRCTGYLPIIEAVQQAAGEMRR